MREDDIGRAAGRVWTYLEANGRSSVSRVARSVEGGQQLALMALGWLAREGKLSFEQDGRQRLVSLKQ